MSQRSPAEQPELVRGIGLAEATTLNMIDMIGVGPFITMPLVIAAAGGPQAMLGWILGAVLALCDGLVWAELGAAMPRPAAHIVISRKSMARVAGRLLSFPVHLAALVQRAVVHRLGLHRPVPLRGISLAGP